MKEWFFDAEGLHLILLFVVASALIAGDILVFKWLIEHNHLFWSIFLGILNGFGYVAVVND